MLVSRGGVALTLGRGPDYMLTSLPRLAVRLQ